MPAPKLLELPPPVAQAWEWQLDARCRGIDGSLFFHPDNERGSARESRVAAAKQVCASCPVRRACGRYALESGERYGIWGGMTEEERRAARARARARNRGRGSGGNGRVDAAVCEPDEPESRVPLRPER